jgi:uncharacterized protein (TIGR02118 family)
MITMLVLVRRKAGTSPEEFYRYWRYEHAALTKTVPDFWSHVRKYVQYHPLESAGELSAFQGEPFGYDGIGQMWFDDVDGMIKTFQHPGYKQLIQPHEAKFVDLAAFKVLVATEVLQYNGEFKSAEA